jgi:hypothetical protein
MDRAIARRNQGLRAAWSIILQEGGQWRSFARDPQMTMYGQPDICNDEI